MIPTDLLTLREAEAHLSIPVATLRRWIRYGRAGVKLQTYRKENMTIIMVSLESVCSLRDRTIKKGKRYGAAGNISIRLNDEDAKCLRQLACSLTARIGVPISYTEAFRLALHAACEKEK